MREAEQKVSNSLSLSNSKLKWKPILQNGNGGPFLSKSINRRILQKKRGIISHDMIYGGKPSETGRSNLKVVGKSGSNGNGAFFSATS